MRLAKNIYVLTQEFPKEERYGLAQQMRRAAVSVPSNIAEGAGRGSRADYLRFLYMARGSLTELDTQVELSTALSYVPEKYEEGLKNLVARVGKTLSGLIGKVKQDMEKSKA